MPAMKPQLRSNVELVEIDDEAILYDPVRDDVHRLSSTAALTVQLCDGTATVHQTATELAAAYGRDPADMERDVRTMVRWLRKSKVLLARPDEDVPLPAEKLDQRDRIRMDVPRSS
jgi:coenzyme PQQ synthesis protein D (PqqD)